MLNLDDDEEKIGRLAFIWTGILTLIWIGAAIFLMSKGQFWSGLGLLILFAFLRKQLKWLGVLIATCQVPLTKQVSHTSTAVTSSIRKRQLEVKEKKRFEQEKLMKARNVIDRRLTEIDGALRVLEEEKDPTERTMTLQMANDQITELSAKRASGEIPESVLTEEKILEHAKATSIHAERLGLGEDRLNLEILRLFNNFVPTSPPLTSADLRAKQAKALQANLQSQAKTLKPHLKSATEKVRQIAVTTGNTSIQDVLARLARVDKVLRYLETEQDSSKRSAEIEKAHVEITALEMLKAAGKLTPDVLTNPVIADHARATSEHLERLGMNQDRLTIEIQRLFS